MIASPEPMGATLRRSDMTTQEPNSAGSSSPRVSRRQLVAFGTTGVAGAVIAKVATAEAAPAARTAIGGIHIDVLGKAVYPEAYKGFPHTFIMTLWGPDNALSGTGCGYTEADPALNLIGGAYANCVFGGHAKVEGDVLTGRAVMAYSADPDEKRGQPFSFEANLSSGFCRFTDMNYGMGTQVVVEGIGTVTRI